MKNTKFWLIGIFVLLAPYFVFGQEEGEEQEVPVASTCFNYYRLDSVRADINPSEKEYAAGDTVTFSGTLVNGNEYPLIGGKLTAKVFLRNDSTFLAGHGNELVDQIVIEENTSLGEDENRSISFDWSIPNTARGGEYYVSYFFSANNGYDVTGISINDDTASNGQTNPFTVIGTPDLKVSSFLKNEVTLNDQAYYSEKDPMYFAADQGVTAKVKLKNPSAKVKTLPVQWNQYDWDAGRDENRKNTKTELITLQPGETKELEYQALPTASSVVYITVFTKDEDSKSFINIRYVRDGVMKTRLVFPGLTKFPLTAEQESGMFACAQAYGAPEVKDNILTLTLRDKFDQIIAQYRYEGAITNMTSGFVNNFVPKEDYDFVKLEASLFQGNNEIERTEVVYDCDAISTGQCQETLGGLKDWLTPKNISIAVISLLGLLVLLTIMASRKRKEINW